MSKSALSSLSHISAETAFCHYNKTYMQKQESSIAGQGNSVFEGGFGFVIEYHPVE
jgi:hypothetical protein